MHSRNSIFRYIKSIIIGKYICFFSHAYIISLKLCIQVQNRCKLLTTYCRFRIKVFVIFIYQLAIFCPFNRPCIPGSIFLKFIFRLCFFHVVQNLQKLCPSYVFRWIEELIFVALHDFVFKAICYAIMIPFILRQSVFVDTEIWNKCHSQLIKPCIAVSSFNIECIYNCGTDTLTNRWVFRLHDSSHGTYYIILSVLTAKVHHFVTAEIENCSKRKCIKEFNFFFFGHILHIHLCHRH